MSETNPGAAPPEDSLADRVKGAQLKLKTQAKQLTDQARALGKIATALGPLAKPAIAEDLVKLPKELAKIEKKLASLAEGARFGGPVLAMVRADMEARRRRIRESLASELQAECAAHGLQYRVVRRDEPVELRLPPFALLIDREKGKAQLHFARSMIAECPADAKAIIAAREKALAELGTRFDPGSYHEACRRAWLGARAATGATDRVEILDFLPYLAMQQQAPKFQVEPITANYRGYSRAAFAWDILRLRKAGGLVHDGWRLNLGVATGTTASKKKRVIWFEDENGEGEFKLTVFFTREEAAR